jgi:hypothetical protein
MAKALAILVLIAAGLCALLVLAASGDNILHALPPLLCLATAAYAFTRGRMGIIPGIVAALAGVVGLLALTEINTKALNFGFAYRNLGHPYMVATGAFVSAAFVAFEWRRIQPWLRYGTLVAALAAFVLTISTPKADLGLAYSAQLGRDAVSALAFLATGVVAVQDLRQALLPAAPNRGGQPGAPSAAASRTGGSPGPPAAPAAPARPAGPSKPR